VEELLKAIEHDSLPLIKKILQNSNIDLNSDVVIGAEYDLDEPDEIPLLFYLIQKGASLEAIELLLDYGMDLTYTNREGLGAIDYAIKYRRKDIVKLCKEKGISLTQSKRKSGLTPLMLAASFNDIDMMQYLIENGAAVEEKDKSGMSALDYATKLGQKKAAQFLEKIVGSDSDSDSDS